MSRVLTAAFRSSGSSLQVLLCYDLQQRNVIVKKARVDKYGVCEDLHARTSAISFVLQVSSKTSKIPN